MHREWMRSPALWLSVALPLVVVAVLGAAVEVSVDGIGSVVGPALIALASACASGLWLAERERRLKVSLGEAGAREDKGPSLPPDRATTYRDLFENATDIVFTTDLSGHFLAGNKAVQRLLGYTVDEARSLTWEKLVAPYDMWKARQMYKRHAGGEKRISFELDTVTASGEIKTFEIGSRPMFRNDELCGFHAIARDVTSRKEMERQLQAARRDAESAAAAKSTFLANMSHEIRTPINGILGFMSLFAQTELTPRQKEYLVPVEESARHLLKIINDILDLSKIEAGRFSIDNEIFCYREVIEGAVDLLRPMAQSKDKGIVVAAEFDDRIPRHVVGDGTRVGQVVSNLVNNAVKFTEAGSVRVSSRVKTATSVDLAIEVSVRDTGIGIAAEHRARLFESFEQLDSTLGRRYAGTGLGLTISKNLVEAMGGGIRVYSEPGEYTEIVFDLPLGLAPESFESAGDALEPSRRFDGAGLSALIVDDNEINRWYLEAVLERCAMAVAQSSSGEEALAACRGGCFDVVFMDIHMADMDGIETARRLRAQIPRYREVPVVAVSADVMGNSRTRFTDQGLDHFLPKPVREDALVRLLSQIWPGRARSGDDIVAAGQPVDDESPARVLDRARGIAMASGNEALWRRSVAGLREQARATLALVHSALEAGDRDRIRQLAHRLAGTAAYAGAEQIAERARRLERAAGSAERVSLDEPVAELDTRIEHLLRLDIDAAE